MIRFTVQEMCVGLSNTSGWWSACARIDIWSVDRGMQRAWVSSARKIA